MKKKKEVTVSFAAKAAGFYPNGIRLTAVIRYEAAHAGLIAALSLMLMMFFAAYTWFQCPPVYEATSKLYAVDASKSILDLSDFQMGNYLTADYQEVFKTWEVNEQVMNMCDLTCTMEEMRERVTVYSPGTSRVIYITCDWDDPMMAARIANAYALAAQNYIESVMGLDMPRMFSVAKANGMPVSSSVTFNAVLGAAVGVVLAMASLALYFLLNDRVRAGEDMCEVAGMPVLGMIPAQSTRERNQEDMVQNAMAMSLLRCETYAACDAAKHPLIEILMGNPLTYEVSEAINTLCSSLIFTKSRCLLFTSCEAGAGKSFVAFHTARTLAVMGQSVVLVDGDLRRSEMYLRLGIQRDRSMMGLSHYLSGQCGRKAVICTTNIAGLSVVMAGTSVVNSMQLLGGNRLKKLLERLQEDYDVVILDTPPVGLIADAALMASACDGAVLVAGDNRVRERELMVARMQLEQAGAPVLGVVMNRVPVAKKRYAYYGKQEEMEEKA